MNLYQLEILGSEADRDYHVLMLHPRKFSQGEIEQMLGKCTANATKRIIEWAGDEDCLADLSFLADALQLEMRDQFGFTPTAPTCSVTISHDTPVQLRCGGSSGFKGSPAPVTDCNPTDKQHPIYMLFLRFLSILLKQPY